MAAGSVIRLGTAIGLGIVFTALPSLASDASIVAADRSQPPTVTVTGCLLFGPHGDYILSKTVVEPAEHEGLPVGTSGAEAPAAYKGSFMHSVAWKLERHPSLMVHVLEKVEVTGTMVPATASSHRLRMKTIRRISGGCS